MRAHGFELLFAACSIFCLQRVHILFAACSIFCLQRVLYFVCSVFYILFAACSTFCLQCVLYFVCRVFYILFAVSCIFCLQRVQTIFCLQRALCFVCSAFYILFAVCFNCILFAACLYFVHSALFVCLQQISLSLLQIALVCDIYSVDSGVPSGPPYLTLLSRASNEKEVCFILVTLHTRSSCC